MTIVIGANAAKQNIKRNAGHAPCTKDQFDKWARFEGVAADACRRTLGVKYKPYIDVSPLQLPSGDIITALSGPSQGDLAVLRPTDLSEKYRLKLARCLNRAAIILLVRSEVVMLFRPKCKACGAPSASIEVIAPHELPSEWTSWPAVRQEAFTKYRKPASYQFLFSGPGGSNGDVGDSITAERAGSIIAAFAGSQTPEKMKAAEFYDGAGWCQECGEFYCPKHWSISSTGYGTCPSGHGKSSGSALVRPIVLVIRSSSHAYVGEPEMSGADGRGA